MVGSAVSAADSPAGRAAPAPVVAAPFTWTGLYVGGNIGWGFASREEWSVNTPLSTFDAAPGLSLDAGLPDTVVPVDVSGTLTVEEGDRDGVLGGAQVGYNWQSGHFVFGLEADIQAINLSDADRSLFTFVASAPAEVVRTALPLTGAGGTNVFVPARPGGGVDWFGTFRARAGFARDRVLVYATGGLAFGGGGDDADCGTAAPLTGTLRCRKDDDWRAGWAAGGGLEWALTNTLTAGLEGLFVSLDRGGNDSNVIGTVVGPGTVTTIVVDGVRRDERLEFGLARAKVNFKF